MTILEAVQAVDPRAVERARRLLFAATLLQSGRTPREASGLVFLRYGGHRSTAWRIVTMAADLVLRQDDKGVKDDAGTSSEVDRRGDRADRSCFA